MNIANTQLLYLKMEMLWDMYQSPEVASSFRNVGFCEVAGARLNRGVAGASVTFSGVARI